MMENIILMLIAYPGTGKYTTAKEICKNDKFKLIDNHLLNNPIFTITERVKKGLLPEEVWVSVAKIRDIVYDAMVNISPKHFSFVLTGCVYKEYEKDQIWFNKVAEIAKQRDALFIPVILTCNEQENLNRVTSEGRSEKMKMVNPENLKEFREKFSLFGTEHSNAISLDVTNLSAVESAIEILKLVKEKI